MECNNYRFGWRKVSEQGREINKMLDLMNIDNIGFGYFRANVSQQVSTRIRQPTHHLPARPSRVLFLVIYPGSPKNSRSAVTETGITQINCHIGIVRVFVAHKHP